MPIYSLYIISKSGSLLYQNDFKVGNSPITKQDSNDYLIIASNLHGIHTIAAKLTPNGARPGYNTNTTDDSHNETEKFGSQLPRTSTTITTTSTLTTNLNSSITTKNSSKSTSMSLNRGNNDDYNNGLSNFNNGGINVNSNKTGLRCVQTEKFNMFVHQTVSGVKIILFTSTNLNEYNISDFQNKIYRLYSDYVMKNPFYSLEMPIRIKLFDDKIISAAINYNIK